MTKKIPTTDDAKKKKLPSGTKVRSTQASVNEAARKAVEKMNRTEEFKKKTQSNNLIILAVDQLKNETAGLIYLVVLVIYQSHNPNLYQVIRRQA